MGDEEECECDEGAPAWMATFSDLATLLLTFFVLLLSFAEMDITEFKTMLGSIREAFGVNTIHPGPHHAAATTPIELLSTSTSQNIMENEERTLLRAIRRYIQKEGLTEQVEVLAGQRGVIVRMKDNVLFDTGSARVKLEGLPILDKIRQLALAFPEGLSVEGHTDDRPISTGQFPSNWELSTARATQVLQELQRGDTLPLKRLQVVGYADTKPLAPNDSVDNQAKNRRVEFVFRRAAPPQTSLAAGATSGDGQTEEDPSVADADSGENAEADSAEAPTPESEAIDALINGTADSDSAGGADEADSDSAEDATADEVSESEQRAADVDGSADAEADGPAGAEADGSADAEADGPAGAEADGPAGAEPVSDAAAAE